MTADVVNLRQARKQKARAEKDRQAAENRAQFGRSRHEKAVTRALKAQVDKALDQGRLEKRDQERGSPMPPGTEQT